MSEKMKKISKKEVSNINKKPKESKTDFFIRMAEKRVKNILKSLRILGNCSNRNNYDYDIAQVDVMFEAIQEGIDNQRAKFTQSKKEVESFKF